jgi:hypothetical protein
LRWILLVMTPTNVENLRSFIAANFTDLAEFLDAVGRGNVDLLAPNITYEDANLPDHIGEAYRGYDGLIRAGRRWLDASDYIALELLEIVGSGDCLVSVHRVTATSRSAQIDLGPATLSYVWIFEEGKVIHLQSYRDRADALAAAGSPTTASSG